MVSSLSNQNFCILGIRNLYWPWHSSYPSLLLWKVGLGMPLAQTQEHSDSKRPETTSSVKLGALDTLVPASETEPSWYLGLYQRDEAFKWFAAYFRLSFQSLCPCGQINLIFLDFLFHMAKMLHHLHFSYLLKVADLETYKECTFELPRPTIWKSLTKQGIYKKNVESNIERAKNKYHVFIWNSAFKCAQTSLPLDNI